MPGCEPFSTVIVTVHQSRTPQLPMPVSKLTVSGPTVAPGSAVHDPDCVPLVSFWWESWICAVPSVWLVIQTVAVRWVAMGLLVGGQTPPSGGGRAGLGCWAMACPGWRGCRTVM